MKLKNLIMSHDMNQAVLTLKDDKPSLEFLGVGRSKHLQQLNALMAKMTNQMGGTFVNNPFYAKLNQQEVSPLLYDVQKCFFGRYTNSYRSRFIPSAA